jgi:hypothetical protein
VTCLSGRCVTQNGLSSALYHKSQYSLVAVSSRISPIIGSSILIIFFPGRLNFWQRAKLGRVAKFAIVVPVMVADPSHG